MPAHNLRFGDQHLEQQFWRWYTTQYLSNFDVAAVFCDICLSVAALKKWANHEPWTNYTLTLSLLVSLFLHLPMLVFYRNAYITHRRQVIFVRRAVISVHISGLFPSMLEPVRSWADVWRALLGASGGLPACVLVKMFRE